MQAGSWGEAPRWRSCAPGLCLEGRCTNSMCTAFLRMVIINKSFGTFDLKYDLKENSNKCPECKNYVKPTTFSVNRCSYHIFAEFEDGEKKELKGETKKGFMEPKVESSNDTAIYNRMTIVTKSNIPGYYYNIYHEAIQNKSFKLKDEIIEESFSKKPECPICLSSLNDNQLVMTDCKHIFCKRCLTKYMKRCGDETKPCPLCRTHIDNVYMIEK